MAKDTNIRFSTAFKNILDLALPDSPEILQAVRQGDPSVVETVRELCKTRLEALPFGVEIALFDIPYDEEQLKRLRTEAGRVLGLQEACKLLDNGRAIDGR